MFWTLDHFVIAESMVPQLPTAFSLPLEGHNRKPFDLSRWACLGMLASAKRGLLQSPAVPVLQGQMACYPLEVTGQPFKGCA